MIKRSLLLIILCASACAAQAEIYKWVDADGKIHYGDVPPKDVKTQKVSGGVTVVPSTVVPSDSASVPKTKAEVDVPEEGGSRGAISRKSEPVAPRSPAELAAAARAEARQKAIELCQQNRGSNCENEVDAQLYGVPGTVFVPLPGWSQPPIRPGHKHVAEPPPRQSAPASVHDIERKPSTGPMKPINK